MKYNLISDLFCVVFKLKRSGLSKIVCNFFIPARPEPVEGYEHQSFSGL
jgi:hypothetical protein